MYMGERDCLNKQACTVYPINYINWYQFNLKEKEQAQHAFDHSGFPLKIRNNFSLKFYDSKIRSVVVFYCIFGEILLSRNN